MLGFRCRLTTASVLGTASRGGERYERKRGDELQIAVARDEGASAMLQGADEWKLFTPTLCLFGYQSL